MPATRQRPHFVAIAERGLSRNWRSTGALVFLSLLGIAQARAETRQCRLPDLHTVGEERAIGANDLMRLRDFGGLGLGNAPAPFALSPDRRFAALQLRQADPATDSYCTALVLMPVRGGGKPYIIDDAGMIIASTSTRYGVTHLPLGTPKPALIVWNPVGRLLAYTKSFPDRSEIWIHDLVGLKSRRLSSSPVDVEALSWSDDGERLLYASRRDLPAARDAIMAEGRSGFRYDGRFWPLSSDMPLPSADVPLIDQSLDAITGQTQPFRPSDKLALHPAVQWPSASVAFAQRGSRTAWSAPADEGIDTPSRLQIRMGNKPLPCRTASCSGVNSLWWSDDGRTLYFQRRTGVGNSLTEFFAWVPGRNVPRRLLSTTDALFGCQYAGDEIICAQEASNTPRLLVAISIRDGARRLLLDPNPEYAALEPGTVRRLEWRNDAGVAAFGDLVLPPRYTPGHRLPLVIVQYQSRGFLRGGTGDEYPIQALAARGFAVLSFNRPQWRPATDEPLNEKEYLRQSMHGFADRRDVLSSLRQVIRQLDLEGLIDPLRVAITGQSDGAVTATFALANSTLFSAAILSTCCESESGLEISGEALDNFYIGIGYPATRASGKPFWRVASLVDAPDARPVPLLIQAASSEFRMGLATYRDLRRRGWPIEMYIYPDEGHVKLHPAHRAAIYDRNIQWLEEQLNPLPATPGG